MPEELLSDEQVGIDSTAQWKEPSWHVPSVPIDETGGEPAQARNPNIVAPPQSVADLYSRPPLTLTPPEPEGPYTAGEYAKDWAGVLLQGPGMSLLGQVIKAEIGKAVGVDGDWNEVS